MFPSNRNCLGLPEPCESASTTFTDTDSIVQTNSQIIFRGKKHPSHAGWIQLLFFTCVHINFRGKKSFKLQKLFICSLWDKRKERQQYIASWRFSFLHLFWVYRCYTNFYSQVFSFLITPCPDQPKICASQSLPPAVVGTFRDLSPCPCVSRCLALHYSASSGGI